MCLRKTPYGRAHYLPTCQCDECKSEREFLGYPHTHHHVSMSPQSARILGLVSPNKLTPQGSVARSLSVIS